MKKRLLSILLMCCMVLTLLPTAAFAEESTETPPVCSCETACTAESMNSGLPRLRRGGRFAGELCKVRSVRPPAGGNLDGVNWRERDGKRSQYRG